MSQPGQEPAEVEPAGEPAAESQPKEPDNRPLDTPGETPDEAPPGEPATAAELATELPTADHGPKPASLPRDEFWRAFEPLRRRLTQPLLLAAGALLVILVLLRRVFGGGASAAEGTPSDDGGGGDELPRMGFWDHLDELRKRLTTVVLVYTVAFFVCWSFARPIYAFLALPIESLLGGEKLVFLKVTDPFLLYMKVAGLAAAFVSAPLIFFQVWGFIAPGLYQTEKRQVYRLGLPFAGFATLLFVAGGVFGYTIAFPFALEFLLAVGEPFKASVTVQSYFGFMMTVILGLGLMFELPALILLLAWLGVVTPGFLLRQSRAAIVLIFVVAAIITPTPDVFNLCVFALPTIGLYFLGVLLAWLVRPKKPPTTTKEDTAALDTSG